MNKTSIKNYATWARRELIRQVSQKAYEYGISEDNIAEVNSGVLGDRVLTKQEQYQRSELVRQIKNKGYTQVMEEVAYTWFNRFIALRFMEVNGYLPSQVRVFSNDENAFSPQIIKDALEVDIEGIKRETVISLIEKQHTEELFKYLIITQCNALGTCLPRMFETIENYTELLFPDNLLKEDSVVGHLVKDIDEDDWKDQVQIIGWLYQFYNEERKNEVINVLKGKAIKKEDIPAATQLFTTDWVVRYIVDNSLGRYWIERNPNSQLKDDLTYLVFAKNHDWNKKYENVEPEDLKVLDPCMGSGHFLVYAFEVLMQIYQERGYSERDAADLIVEKNIYGLDIDDRASQLAYFAVMMKARSYDRRFLTRNIQPHTQSIIESNGIEFSAPWRLADEESIANNLIDKFKDAKELGSIIDIDVSISDLDRLSARLDDIYKMTDYGTLTDMASSNEITDAMYPLLNQAYIFVQKYDVVFTNPPFLNKMDATLKNYVNQHYKEYSGDLFSVFIYRNFGFCKPEGYSGFMSPFVWMFIKTYEALREYIIRNKNIATLIQMEYSAFEEATVPICSFVLKNINDGEEGCYFRLSEFVGGMEVQKNKILEALNYTDCKYYYEASTDNFSKIPGSPIAYWLSDNVMNSFMHPALGNILVTREGMATADNDRFLRLWYEPNIQEVFFDLEPGYIINKEVAWIPYNKGGEFRKWYGNNDYVVNWGNDGQAIRNNIDEKSGRIRSHNYNGEFGFMSGITWSALSSGNISVRYCRNGFLFDSKGAKGFAHTEDELFYCQALINSNVGLLFLQFLSPTIDFKVGDIILIPLIQSRKQEICSTTEKCIILSSNDWDSFETSWDFKKHPLI